VLPGATGSGRGNHPDQVATRSGDCALVANADVIGRESRTTGACSARVDPVTSCTPCAGS
jgi:hypothetical protein